MSAKHIRVIGDLVRFKASIRLDCRDCASARTMTGPEAVTAFGSCPLETAERRTLGLEPMVFGPDAPVAATPSPPPDGTPTPPPKPPASALVEGFFERRARRDKATEKQTEMERGTLRRFLETRGDKPPADYSRRDVNGFLDTLRRLPATYGKSPRDKDRTLAESVPQVSARSRIDISVRF